MGEHDYNVSLNAICDFEDDNNRYSMDITVIPPQKVDTLTDDDGSDSCDYDLSDNSGDDDDGSDNSDSCDGDDDGGDNDGDDDGDDDGSNGNDDVGCDGHRCPQQRTSVEPASLGG